ncbi:MAG: excisionase family DNA-binding protein [Rhodothermales bacterium]|nr:excisionase family DNA-binding protein [Rhodothermales bacterium]
MNDLDSQTLSPKELAAVVGVSQSSIKRWVDVGHIAVTRTAGGHRRISRNAALRFIRSKRMRVVRPDLLGIPDLANVDRPLESGTVSGEFLHSLLAAGDVAQVRRVVTAAFLSGTQAAVLFDGPIADAMVKIGEIWTTDQRGIYIEHGATAAFIEVISQLVALIGAPDDDAPLAIGAAPLKDPHIIPSQMASAVFQEAGWRTINMGPATPPHAILDACEAHEADAVWLAVKSRLGSRDLESLSEMCSTLNEKGVKIIAGGREVERTGSLWPDNVQQIFTMTDLAVEARRMLDEKKAQ